MYGDDYDIPFGSIAASTSSAVAGTSKIRILPRNVVFCVIKISKICSSEAYTLFREIIRDRIDSNQLLPLDFFVASHSKRSLKS